MLTRMRGLLGRVDMKGIDGAYISPCQAVHTFLMRFPIDVVFIATDGMVVDIIHNLQPNKTTSIRRNARSVIELDAGQAETLSIKLGGRFKCEIRSSKGL
ncbi:MAG: DUF192 domain-containing protein [bacterium]|nr:DUF192 domain-containing protein [bacterium]MDD4557712.1 DUF192 domain-containing protein [bacterium]